MADPQLVSSVLKSLSGIESGGDPSAAGPTTSSGDRARGKYQIMGANVPEWTRDALGTEMTPDAFAADPDAQEKVATHRVNKYLDESGGNVKDVAARWHSGVPYDQAVAENRKDQLGTRTQDYADRVEREVGAAGAEAAEAIGAGTSADFKVRLPDGRLVNMGPNPTPEMKAQLKAKIAEKWPNWQELAKGGKPAVAPPSTVTNPETSTTTTTTSTSPAEPPPAPKRMRDVSYEEVGTEINRKFGKPDDHWTGRYAAEIGKPGVDAVEDFVDAVASPKETGEKLLGMTAGPAGLQDSMETLAKVLHPLAVPGEAAGNIVFRAVMDKTGNPTLAATLGAGVGAIVGLMQPIPFGRTAHITGDATKVVKGATEANVAVDALETARRAKEVADVAPEFAGFGERAVAEKAKSTAEAAAKTAEEAKLAATAVEPVPVAPSTLGEAERTAALEAERVAAEAKAKTAPPPEEIKAALTPAEVTPEQGGQAARVGLEKEFAEVETPVKGIYDKFVEKNARTEIPDVYNAALSEQIGALEAELGPTLTGQTKAILTNLKEKAGKHIPLTVDDYNVFKQQLDSALPGGRAPANATPRTKALYEFKYEVRKAMRSVADDAEKEWLEAADNLYKNELKGKDQPRAIGQLVKLAKKHDPAVFVEKVFGNGTTADQGLHASEVLRRLDPLTSEAVRQSWWGRMTEKGADAQDLLKSYDALNPEFKSAITTPESRAFFEGIRESGTQAERAAEWAKAAKKAADEMTALGEQSAKEAAKAATTAKKAAASQKVAETGIAAKRAAMEAKAAKQVADEATKAGIKNAKTQAERAEIWAEAAKKVAAEAAEPEAPGKLATWTAKGLSLAIGHKVGKMVGHPFMGMALGHALIPAAIVAKMLANPKTAGYLARLVKTPVNSAVVPTLINMLPEMKKRVGEEGE